MTPMLTRARTTRHHRNSIMVNNPGCARANDWDRAASRQVARETRDANKRLQQLERELARKDKALAEAAALMILQKKAAAIWGPEGGAEDGRQPHIAETNQPSKKRLCPLARATPLPALCRASARAPCNDGKI